MSTVFMLSRRLCQDEFPKHTGIINTCNISSVSYWVIPPLNRGIAIRKLNSRVAFDVLFE
jgi:hypothetical protein